MVSRPRDGAGGGWGAFQKLTVLPHVQPGSAAGWCAWLLIPLAQGKRKSPREGSEGRWGCSTSESPAGQARADAKGGDGLPALASSLPLVWESNFRNDSNTCREAAVTG